MSAWEIINKNIGDEIPVKSIDSHYGGAEFVICPVFQDGFMRELYITPKQQSDYLGKMFKVDLTTMGINVLSLNGYPALVNDPNVWLTYWCQEHKCYSLELYVSNGTKLLKIDTHFGNTISLNFK
jgi:hypothetical protein